jgi:DNA-binding IclR family transcriptional regulator
MIDGGNINCDGLSETGRGRAVNDDQFMIADLHKSMVVHRTSIALGEHSPLFGGTLGHLLLVAANAGETADARVRSMTVKTIADYMLNLIPWFYRLGGQQENDFL